MPREAFNRVIELCAARNFTRIHVKDLWASRTAPRLAGIA